MASRAAVVEGLELLLQRIDREIAVVETRLQRMAHRLGLSSWRELESLLASGALDTPEADMMWPEYQYLRDRLEALKKRRREVLAQLGRVEA